MIELVGDLWRLPALVRCITTNGEVDSRGRAVMGVGCAKQAADFEPALKADLGRKLTECGNHVHILRQRPGRAMLVSFPTKHRWRESANLDLILRSANELVSTVNIYALLVNDNGDIPDGSVLLPRPGCGAGQLSWEQVAEVLRPVLDDRFAAVSL